MGAWGYGAFQNDPSQDWIWAGGVRDAIIKGLKERGDQFGVIRMAAAQTMVALARNTSQGRAAFSDEDVELAIESVESVIDEQDADEAWSSYRDPAAARRSMKNLLASVKRLR